MSIDEESSGMIPEMIIPEILLRLPVKPLFRFKCVSKSWNELISEPSFGKNHNKLASTTHNLDNLILKHSRNPTKMELFSGGVLTEIHLEGENGDELELIGSCNGVVCFAVLPVYGGFRVVLWNPSTGKKFKVPETPYINKSDQLRFCLNPDGTDEFKIVNIVGSSVHVYSLSSNSWHDAGKTYPPGMISGDKAEQTVVQGSAHWCTKDQNGVGLILAFDPRNDQFKKINLPPVGQSRTTIANKGGSLAVIAEREDEEFEVWVMREYDVVESWTRMYVVQRPRGLDCYYKCIWKNRIVFLLDRQGHHGRTRLGWYDERSKSFETILMAGSTDYEVISYGETMVSVESRAPNPNSNMDSEIPGTDWYIAGLTDMGVYY